MGVYQITNEKNGKVYIGSSNNLDGLWNRERFILDMGTHMNKGLQGDWKQHGAEAFRFEIVEIYKPEEKLRYDYKDVRDEEGQELAGVVRDYRRKMEKLKERWLEKLQPYGEKGYH
ncbi:GIY-YIG nuclease family protein [Paenibacillus sp. J5C_2022]|nr:GIY-YIG nuclease family protein [Paenibacillus sp. J5C2022]MCU6712840.1 GIY-YIG nuclease family protein [Paenibacillus sp. J5C2022]